VHEQLGAEQLNEGTCIYQPSYADKRAQCTADKEISQEDHFGWALPDSLDGTHHYDDPQDRANKEKGSEE